MTPTATLVPLRWSDMDAYGHVNNVQYLRLLEEARITAFDGWFRGPGHDGQESMLEGGVIVARSEIEYLRPLAYRRSPVEVTVWVTAIGGSSFDLGYEVRDPADVGETTYARAESTMAAFDLAAQTPRRLPDSERDSLRAHLGEPVAMRRRRR